MSESEDEDHEYALYGTLLDPIEEDNVQARKPISVQEQIATDKHGKRRFHGAFTGGFSAGFCNTVGSLEGWTPSTFKSSRAERASSRLDQPRPEDFMDEEDLSEFGIAPKSIQIASRFEPSAGESANQSRRHTNVEGVIIPGVPVLETLLQAVPDTIGSKLLRAMGWKPGQGIGPRLSARDKQTRAKKYGCAMPGDTSAGEQDDSGEDESGLTYAPDEYLPYLVKTKDDEFGLGYKGLDRKPVLSNDRRGFSLFDGDTLSGQGQEPGVTFIGRNNKKVKIHGQAFGVGAFEAEDEDIYAVDDMSRYDLSLAPSGSAKPRDPTKRTGTGVAATRSGGETVPGFRLSSATSQFTKVFPPPVLPPDYVPRPPAFVSTQASLPNIPPSAAAQATPSGDHPIRQARSAFERAAILDEPLPIPVKASREVPSATSSTRFSQSNDSSHAATIALHQGSSQGHATLSQGQSNAQGQGSKDACVVQGEADGVPDRKAFRPFASEPEKQSRYEQFAVLFKQGMKDKLSDIQPASMTEWEKQREAAEFASAHALYTPLSGGMADRFTRGSQPDDTNPLVKVEKCAEPGDEVLKNAARSKMFGKLTRDTAVWVPSDLLCKRFNIRPPVFDYRNPSSTHAQKKRRNTNYSLFEFLNAPSPAVSETSTPDTAGQNRVSHRDETNQQSVSQTIEKEKLPNPFREDGSEVGKHPVDHSSRLEDIPLTAENKIDLFKAIFLSSDEEDDGDTKEDAKNKDQRIEDGKEANSEAEKVNTENTGGTDQPVESGGKLGDNEEISNSEVEKNDKSKSCDKSKDNPMKLIDQEMLGNSKRDQTEPDSTDGAGSYGPRLPDTSAGQTERDSHSQPPSGVCDGVDELGKNPMTHELQELRKSKIRNSEVMGVRFEKPAKSCRKTDGTKNSKETVERSKADVDGELSPSLKTKMADEENEESEWVDVGEVSEDDADKSEDAKQRKKKRKKKGHKSKRVCSDSSSSDDGEIRSKAKDARRLLGRKHLSSAEEEKRRKSKRKYSSSSEEEKRHKSKRKYSSSSKEEKRHKSKRKYSSSSEEEKRHKSKRKYSSSSEEEKRHKSKRKYSSSSEEQKSEKRRKSKKKRNKKSKR